LLHEMPTVPYGASLLVVSAVTTPTLMGTLQRIKKHNRKITLLSLAEQPPESQPGILVLHRPFRESTSAKMKVDNVGDD
jgi:hypothetical protein